MKKQQLNENWFMDWQGELLETGGVPCSMYSTLLKNRLIDNPYYRENERTAKELSRDDYVFSTKFMVEDCYLESCEPTLCFEMLDTLADGDQIPDEVKMAKVDIDEAPLIAAKFEVDVIPTLVVFRDGMEVGRIVGETDKNHLLGLFED